MSNRKPRAGTIYQRKKKLPDGSVVTLPTYWIQYCWNGRPYRESAKTKDFAQAERALKRRQGELVTGRFAGLEPERVLVSQLLDDVLDDFRANSRKSLPSVEGGIRLHVRPAFGHVRVAGFNTTLLKKYISTRKLEGAANATINRELTILKRAFNLGFRAEPPLVMRVPHIPHLDEDNVRTGFLEKGEYRKLRDLLPPYLQLLFVLGYHTGARVGEIRRLRWTQVVGERIVLHPGTTKNKQGRWLPIYGDLEEWIERARAERERFPNCPYLCHHDGQPLGDSCVKKAWKTACDAAGLSGLHFHDLRRSAVRNMDRAGVPRPVAMRISGHRTESMYNRYNIVSERDLGDVKEKMERFLSDTLSDTPKQNSHEQKKGSGRKSKK
jgi:integrase